MYFIQGLKKYFDFKGRATRTEFWCFTLSVLVISAFLSMIDALLGTDNYAEFGLLSGVFQLIVFAPTLAVGSRRLHDIGKSGWWQLLYLTLVGLLVLVVFWVMSSKPEDNKYGEYIVDELKASHLLAQAFLLVIAFLLFAMHSNDIEQVKDTVMDMDKSLTVGEAFDNWHDCASRKWEAFETDNGRKVVQFTCDVKNVRQYLGEVAQYTNVQDDALDVDTQKQIIQWRINKDSTISLSHVGFELIWLDGKFSEGKSNAKEVIHSAYQNKITYDLDELDDMSYDSKKIIFSQWVSVFRTAYAQSK